MCGFAPVAQSQVTSPLKNLITSASGIVRDTISGVNLDVNEVSPLAQHGDVDVVILTSGGGSNPYVYEVRYQPDPGFIGVDTFTLEYIYNGTYPYLIYRGYRVSVFESIITTRPDFVTTTTGTPAVLNVLSNDDGTNTPLSISAVPLVNNGTASIAGNTIVFTPDAGFTGVASLNYTVCDVLGNCKTGSASIGVNDNMAPADDTLRIATAKNTQISIPLSYNGFNVFQAPNNGVLTLQNGHAFRYVPNSNFTGVDQFVLSNSIFGQTFYKTVILDVLNTPTQNTMAMDDYVFTPRNTAITFNVRTNDIGNLLVKSWVVPNNFPGTISGTTQGGNVTFTPNTGFSGVATFYYKVGNQFIPDIEMAAVNVIVGNMNPAAGTFDLTTPESTPLVINYQIPFIGFDFAILDAPDHGTCTYFPDFSTQVINGQTVSGNNLLIYTPNPGFIGLDEFEINYCVTSNNQCQSVKIVANVVEVISTQGPYCVDDCVWVGDINADGIVNNKDVLPLGYSIGIEGTLRDDAALEWYGQYADNWSNPYMEDPIDLKHCDTDGNGIVSSEDTLAIGFFYGQTHKLIPQTPPTTKGLPFFLKNLTPNAGVGDLVQIEVSLGNNANPVTNIYGFTFDLKLGQTIVDSALQMRYFSNTWLNLNAPCLWLSKNPVQRKLETAFTRTGGSAMSGFGKVGQADFIITDIIIGGKLGQEAYYTVEVESPSIMTGDGKVLTGESMTFTYPLQLGNNIQRATTENDLFVYPSPASDLVQFHLNGTEFIEDLKVYDLRGELVYTSGKVAWEHAEINFSHLPDGVYLATVQTAGTRLVKKFQIIH